MRRNRKDNTKKERIIMIASSAFVLAALTMTGVYMQGRDDDTENDGYTIDFSSLENHEEEKGSEIAEANPGPSIPNSNIADNVNDMIGKQEDDLDYDSMEAGSGLVEIPGLTDGGENKKSDGKSDGSDEAENTDVTEGSGTDQDDAPKQAGIGEDTGDAPADQANTPDVSAQAGDDGTVTDDTSYQADAAQTGTSEGEAAMGGDVVVQPELHFSANDGLRMPFSGDWNVIIPFSMEKSVYFETLDEYKRSRGMVIGAPEGTTVTACASGRVVNVYQNEEYGSAVTVELGDGYQITYGQLRDIQVAVGSYVNTGDVIAAVAAPAKYYLLEGSNLYLQLTENGTEIDPSPLLF